MDDIKTFELDAKTQDFVDFEFVTFLDSIGEYAAFECTTGIRQGILYAVTRRDTANINEEESYLTLHKINLSTMGVSKPIYFAGCNSRPCIFAHKNGDLILYYNLTGRRSRGRLTWLTKLFTVGSQNLSDVKFTTIDYCCFTPCSDEDKYYILAAINGQLTLTTIDEPEKYTLSDARNLIDNLLL